MDGSTRGASARFPGKSPFGARRARLTNALGGLAVAVTVAACASAGPGEPMTPAPSAPAAGATGRDTLSVQWPVKTREHVDLWLHGYAMLMTDTTKVPYFRRGYRDEMVVIKNQSRITSLLDTNRETLARRFASHPQLVGTQFLALYFGRWEDLREVVNLFLQLDGDVSRAAEGARPYVGLLASNFPSRADRDWLRMFVESLEDEKAKFYHGFWVGEQRSRSQVLARVDSLWQQRHRPQLQRYLNNTQQATGDFLLSLPLNGEGRTVTVGSLNIIAGTFPVREAEAIEAIYVFVHEASGAVVNTAVRDNITPAEQRAGLADRYSSAGLVRGGAAVLAKIATELVDGYARYYLRSAGRTPTGDVRAALAAEFQLPETIMGAITRQIDIVLGGI